ncbi:terminase small subunit [Fructobacillus ficulneus]|uniref:Prophage Lp2 protein 34 n=1 Tax=Fructobacillus ficulneus TaxID=157463 RepID=A0A0K8MI26_9LACO|nr:terminase small subunit [Fructobacillus ficulneus]GAO99843.1 prophage Lp2 protein 34 [Fructobacillus ficulneus]
MKLTPKQLKWADEYIESGNATQSAIKAGYSKKTARQIGQQNLSKLVIKEYIDKRMAEIDSKRIMSAKEAVQLLTSIARGEIKETVVMSTPFGIEETEKEADLKTRISATKEILKRYPGSDKMAEQQLRKVTAEADILSAKAKELQGGGNQQDNLLGSIAESLGEINETDG